MVELFASRRRAEELARALEGGEQTTDARLQRLLGTASRLAAVPVVEPRAEFRDTLRERLMEAAAVELPTQAAARSDDSGEAAPGRGRPVVTDDAYAARRRRRLVAVATGLVLVGGGTGVAAASEQALPGQMLYPVKRTIESAQVSLARGAGAEGRALLDRASTRLDEAETLSSNGAPTATDLDSIEGTLDDFAADAAGGGERLLAAYAASGDPADLQALRDFTADSHETLSDLAQTLPPEARDAVVAADETVVALDGEASQACPDCTSTLPPLDLLVDPVSLPQLGENASPYVPGTSPLTVPDLSDTQKSRADETTGQRPGGAHAPPARPAPDDAAPELPDVELSGPAGQPQTQQDQGAAPDQGGGDQPRRQPRLDDLSDLLDPRTPSPPPRSTDGPDLGDLGDVTEPLTEPVDPLLDGTRKGLDRTRKGLDGPREQLERTREDLDLPGGLL
ncbi:MAG TPA: DUF5667 domain-containing protein [Nocardioidaceae bacterium]|nr:DUF5667 domain-containing protein [Nocardioidaceae bacterium]